ncbi:lipocalin family protein [Albimonas pacifica]|uniref:Outer membrane lipoprotein Blc n=1 Tax=Albimonas pacifica TaxID=1114924 RepID=A0A1I3KN79_9RHOB|nr:lipocalin family protein [Albimonas pacifica]SFI73961.1 apolipoprotein D and lipocalin family protein [Albimonas pacifica]
MRSLVPPPGRLAAALLLAAGLASPALADEAAGVQPVSGFELERYLGLWHEIAVIPNWFQSDCAAATTATYAPAQDVDGIEVINSCLEADGARATAEGRARFTGASDRGALEVAFVSVLGTWLWPLSGDYIVFALDPDYQWTAIGHPSRDYGWILARDETLPPETLAGIRARFVAAGYDPCALLMSPRAVGDPRTPLCELP